MRHIGWVQKQFGHLAATALPWYAETMDYRVSSYAPNTDPGLAEFDQRCLYVFWHEYIGPLLSKWGWCNLTLLVSQHRDAEWLNQAAGRMGYRMARGSSTRGGPGAIRRLKELGTKSSLVITPDGPRGPRRQMAPGALYIASELQMPIVPVGVGLSNFRRLNTWDRFAVPLPMSRVRVVFGPKVDIPPHLDREDLNAMGQPIANLINEISDVAQSWADRRSNFGGYCPLGRKRQGTLQRDLSNSTPSDGQNLPVLLPYRRRAA